MHTLIHQPGNYINSSPSRPELTHPFAPLWEERCQETQGSSRKQTKERELEDWVLAGPPRFLFPLLWRAATPG
jgi:hypothetical protein